MKKYRIAIDILVKNVPLFKYLAGTGKEECRNTRIKASQHSERMILLGCREALDTLTLLKQNKAS